MSVIHNQPDINKPDFGSSAIRGGSLNYSFEQARLLFDLEKDYPETKGMSKEEKVAFVNAKHADLQKNLAVNKVELDRLRNERDRTSFLSDHANGVTAWLHECTKIEKPIGPHFREMRRAVAAGDTVYISGDIFAETPALDYEKEVFRFAHVMVVEHDWAGAFAGSDLNSAIKLPYDLCAFEFQYSGHPVIAFATQVGSDIFLCVIVKWQGKWTIPAFCTAMESNAQIRGDISQQIRAVCIALDAEIAYSEVRREDHSGKGNGSPQLRDYNVVSLYPRNKRALPPELSSPTGRRIRLHFRRGHWRHLGEQKTWIKWTLVGNPDLGFVDKHYRL